MQRRTALKAVGASVLAGTALTSSATATDDDPRIVAVDSEIESEGTGRGPEYAVEYGDDGVVEITGSKDVPQPCYEVEVVGIESTRFGDVVRVAERRTDEVCPDAVARLRFEIELEYDGEADDVFVEFVDESSRKRLELH